MNKTILIPGWKVGENSFGVGISYLEFISKLGNCKIIMPDDVGNLPKGDLLILPGGADILPSTYGSIPGYRTGSPNLMLEHFDKTMLPKYIKNGTPIFSICRGAQRIWTMYGGKFIQHNPYHHQTNPGENEYRGHELWFTDKFKQYDKLIHKVTSRHHQTMDGSKDIPLELEVIAYANETYKVNNVEHDNVKKDIVEIFKHKDKSIYGVQFHPEDHSADYLSTEIINELLG